MLCFLHVHKKVWKTRTDYANMRRKAEKMAEKDITEKQLASYNDVFADIVNVLLFDGERLVKEEELENDTARSAVKFHDALHEQERDVAKFWKHSNVRIALYGLENQTDIDVDIPLRVLSYDGASYRAQLNGKQRKRYPVVTLILYFGEQRWNRPHSLHDCLDIPEELKPFVSDYKVNVFEIAWLSDEQVKLFQSDFRFVADYFVQTRKNKNYIPPGELVTHAHEVLQLMAAVSGSERFEKAANEVRRGEKISMYSYFDEVEDRGIQKGISIGKAEAAKNYESVLAEKDAKYAALEKELARYKAMAMKQ